MFRDESNHVIKKATNTRSRATRLATRSAQRSRTAPAAMTQTVCSSTGSEAAAQVLAHPSLSTAHLLPLSQKPAVPNTAMSSSRSAASHLVATNGHGMGMSRWQHRHSRSHRSGAYGHSPLLGILTPRSGRISSTNSDDSRSDEDCEAAHDCQLIFNYYDPELETCLPRLLNVEGEETDSTDDGEEARKSLGSLTYSLSPSLCERGIAFFFSRYVAVEATCHQGFDFIYEVWKPPTHPGTYFASSMDGVTASMIAVGLAGLSKLTGSREAQIQAQHSYGIALNMTNSALRDQNQRSTDSTMLAVLILGTYEFLSGRTPQTMSAWQKHVTGAAALASMRGTAQFSSNAGTRMFLMLCHSVLVNCIQSGLPMPESMVKLRLELVSQSDAQRSSWKLAEPVYRALQTRYDINRGRITNLDEIIRRLNDIDEEFAKIISTLPDSWAYRSVKLGQDNPAVFGRYCHIYTGLQQVTLWNGLRTVRMLLHETILEQLYTYAATFPSMTSIEVHYQQLLVKTMDMLAMLGDAIIASVPQHFGVVSARSASPGRSRQGASPFSGRSDTIRRMLSGDQGRSVSPANPHATIRVLPSIVSGPTLFDPTKSAGTEGQAERFMTLASASNTILWPLYVLGMSSSCTPEKREYVMDRIDAVYRETKLEQAQTVVRLLESRSESVAWESIPLAELPAPQPGLLAGVM